MSPEGWIAAAGIVVFVGGAVITSNVAVWWRIGRLTATLDALVKGAAGHEQEHVRIWETLTDHTREIAGLKGNYK